MLQKKRRNKQKQSGVKIDQAFIDQALKDYLQNGGKIKIVCCPELMTVSNYGHDNGQDSVDKFLMGN